MAKKNTRTILFVGLILGAMYWISQRTIALISFGGPSMRIHKVTLDGIEMRITLPIKNESDISAPVSAFLGDLMYNGTSLGVLSLVNPVTLPGFGQTTLEFRLVSGLFGTAYEIVSILTNGDPIGGWKNINYSNVDWQKFTIRGTLKVGTLPVPINTKLLG